MPVRDHRLAHNYNQVTYAYIDEKIHAVFKQLNYKVSPKFHWAKVMASRRIVKVLYTCLQ